MAEKIHVIKWIFFAILRLATIEEITYDAIEGCNNK
jgi:hypothetical protein